MSRLILSGILFVFIFILRFIIHLYLISRKKTNTKKKLNQIGDPIEIQYLTKRFNLLPSKMKSIKIGLFISIIDAFIIAFTVYIASMVSDSVLVEILVGTVLVFVLIFSINELFGRILKRKGYDKK